MKGDTQDSAPKPLISEKRQKILDRALSQLRRARADMDPRIILKIKSLIAGSPELMKKLGIEGGKLPEDNKAKSQPLPPQPSPPKTNAREITPPSKPVEKQNEGMEKIDQGKNMEVMAKLMALSPDNKERIKSVIKKVQE